MADTQRTSGKRRDKRGRQTAASDTQEWEPRRGASRHSLPHRPRQPEIQKSDRKKSKNASRPSRTFEDLADTHSMPGQVRVLARRAASRSRGRQAYDEDDDDDAYDDNGRERLRGRLRSSSRPAPWGGKSAATSRAASRAPSARPKPRAKSRPISQGSRSTDSSPAPTPTRSSYAPPFRSAPSAPSIGAVSDSSTDDSDDSSSGSTRYNRTRPRTLKERMGGTPDSEPMPISANRSRSRHKSHERLMPEKLVPEIESPSEDSDDQAISHPRIIVRKQRSVSRHRQAQQSRSRSRPPLSHRQSGRSGRSGRDSGHASVSPKRTKNYYHSDDDSYSKEPSFPRSRATSASRMKVATKSVGSSSKQSLGNYFQTSGQPQPQNAIAKFHPCVACNEGMSNKKLSKLKCGHRWCNTCLKRRFKISIDDPQSMPPRCCTADIIPLKHVNDLFDDNFKKTWNERFAKFSARDHNYCPKKKCRERIRPADLRHHSDGRTSATCRKCDTEICGLCYKKWHESKHCPTDADTAQFLKVAKDAGWKRCYHCQAMVELKEGCNHMTCRCGAQFCMICGLKWRSCDCPWFSYQMEDEDAMAHMQIPPPMVSRERLGGTDGLPRGMRPDLAYAQEPRRHSHRGPRGDDRGRRPPPIYPDLEDEEEDEEDEEDDDYLHHAMSDPMSMGNMAGHYMNDDYQRRPFGVMPPAPVPVAPPATAPAMHERTKSGTNYLSGVNKARGVRASSMERRLADRLSEQRQNFTPPPPRPFGQPVTLTAPPMGMNPPPHQPPMVPSPMTRRHTMDNDLYDAPFDPRYAPQSIPRRPAPHTYMDDLAIHAPPGRRRYRQMEPPRPSELAGLTGPGGGVNRVYEWANHVESHYQDNQTVA